MEASRQLVLTAKLEGPSKEPLESTSMAKMQEPQMRFLGDLCDEAEAVSTSSGGRDYGKTQDLHFLKPSLSFAFLLRRDYNLCLKSDPKGPCAEGEVPSPWCYW